MTNDSFLSEQQYMDVFTERNCTGIGHTLYDGLLAIKVLGRRFDINNLSNIESFKDVKLKVSKIQYLTKKYKLSDYK